MMKISYITLGVGDLPRMKQFYLALGFQIIKESKDENHPYVMFESSRLVFALYPRELLAKQSGLSIDDKGINASISLSLNVGEKNVVDDILGIALNEGAQLCQQGFKPAWGGYCAYFKDPEENLWEIVWHPKYKF